MHYVALATDFDGTIAHDGVVDAPTIAALEQLRAASRRIILVTGRQLDDLLALPWIHLFDRVVAENGAVLYCPATREERLLAEPPLPRFVQTLRDAGITPLSLGRVIVATWEPNETVVFQTIRDLGLGWQVIFNKGAVMALPAGVSKESGLRAALAELEIAPLNTVAVGDAENDFAFVDLCGLSVAVANALPMLKEAAGLVTEGARGEGVRELIGRMLDNDLADVDAGNRHQRMALAGPLEGNEDAPLDFVPVRENLLLVGVSGGGKSTLTTGLLERLAERKFQCCVIDPEGDYECLDDAVTVGTAKEPARVDAVLDVLSKTTASASVNLLGIKLADRPAFFAQLLAALVALRARVGRPHFVVVDEAHHMLPEGHHAGSATFPDDEKGFLFVTIRPQSLDHRVLADVDRIIAVGSEVGAALTAFCEARGLPAPEAPAELPVGALATVSVADPAVRIMTAIPGKGTRRRHLRKYAEGKLGDDRSFFYRGPDDRLNLRAANLISFLDLGEGVDEETWEFHRRRGDYSRWIGEAIKDRDLAREVAEVESSGQPANAARTAMREAIETRYTLPE